MRVHLVDGTYELFRYFFALPSHVTAEREEVSATRGAVGTVLSILEQGGTHVGVATDHVIESFRNDMWPTYKSSAGVDPSLLSQFPLFEEALDAMGVAVWPMVELEADDALATVAKVAAADERVKQVVICTPDKDLGQCVVGKRVVQLDRRRNTVTDADGVRAKFGVGPASVPDYLALVGDSADGFPGLPGWGAKTASAVLAKYEHLEGIPDDPTTWKVDVRSPVRLARTLKAEWENAYLFRVLATLRTEADVGSVDDWRWTGPGPEFAAICDRIDAPELVERAEKLAAKRAN